ncbi:hypothetical protein M433DRAFT_542188, partial [Acidomyces richmondensis BFW]
RKVRKKGKRVALKGKFLFSTQEVLDIARAAEQGTAAKNSHRRRHTHPQIKSLVRWRERYLRMYLAILRAIASMLRREDKVDGGKVRSWCGSKRGAAVRGELR